jgi:transposase
MSIGPGIGLSEGEKDVLLAQQQAMIERLVARISELEALVGKPRKTSSNSHTPPSKDGFGCGKKGRKASGEKAAFARRQGAAADGDTGQDRTRCCQFLRPLRDRCV